MPVAVVRRGRLALVAALLAAIGGLVLASPPVAAAPRTATSVLGCSAEDRAAGRVGVAVSFPGQPLFTACVAAGGSGIDVLRRAGLAPVVQGFGSVSGSGAVCALTDPRRGEQVGCAAGPSCLTCADPRSWAYYPGYRYSSVGAGSTSPAGGAIEAWQWGSATSWSGGRAYDMCEEAPPPSTPTPTTTPPTSPAPPVTDAPGPGGGGSAAPGSGGGSSGGSPGSAGAPSGADGAPSPSGDPASGGPTTTRPGGSSTTSPSTTTTVAVGAGTDPEGEVAAGEADGVTDGEGDERAQGVPDGSMSVTEDDGGGSGALVPVATTTGLVAALSVVAVRARRRRAVDEPSG